jgi:hypothetical protein
MSFRTNIGGKLYIAAAGAIPAAQNTDLDESGFNGISSWVEIPNVGNIGDTGVDQNMVSYPIWGSALAVQLKGSATGAQAEIRVLDVDSNGLNALKAAAAVTNLNNYAFKIEWPDGSIEFNRGVVGAPSYSKGANEDFSEAVFTLALNQEPVFSEVTS